MSTVVTIETPELGDRSYLVHDGDVALVVDPQRDIDRIVRAASDAGVQIMAVAETHMHNDYVTGGLALAALTGAEYLVAGTDDVGFDRRPVVDGDEVKVGRMVVSVLSTPGHTRNHLSYVVSEDAHPQAVFTGGSLLYGTVGRTDLLGPELTEELTRSQHRSVHRLVRDLAPDVAVYPTHGFGSFCSSAASSGAPSGTIGDEATGNMAMQIEDEDEFVRTLLAGLTAYPRYYVHMGPINLAGPPPIDLKAPERVDVEELRARLQAGEWVVDLRQRRAYARRHLAGTLGVELGTLFATYVGWVLPWDIPITLIGDSLEEVGEAQRALVRIGIDRLAGAAVGTPDDLAEASAPASYPVSDFAGLAAAGGPSSVVVLDVRRDDEWASSGHIDGALHIPLQDLYERLGEVPTDALWVHCAAGFRASIAASLLDRAGHRVVLIDDDFATAADAGLPMVGP